MPRTQIFVSYSHKDKTWLERLQVHLKPLERFGLHRWDDTRIRPGGRWLEEIQQAVTDANAIVLLVSADFLASDFIRNKELPELLREAAERGAAVLPVIIGACLFEETPSISVFQSVNSPNSPLDSLSPSDQNRVWVDVARRVQEVLETPALQELDDRPPPPPVPPPAPEPSMAAGHRHALILEVTRYSDPFYNELAGGSASISGLVEVLADPKIGGFTVTTLTNETAQRLKDTVRSFLSGRAPEDQVVVYIPGLAVKDSDFGLHFITADSVRDDLETTVSGASIQSAMHRCKAQLQLFIFDCRYAGAFHPGKIDPEASVGPLAGMQGEGRFVLSATNLMSWAWEKDGASQVQTLRDVQSAFLTDITHGLKTGKADVDKNLKITVGELFDYIAAEDKARAPDAASDVRPCRWAFDQSKADCFVMAEAKLPAEGLPPTPRRRRFTVSQDIRRPILDLIAPSYILDERYYLLDWNPAFDELIAKPLKLVRGAMHAGVFIRELENSEDVVKHANDVFGGDIQHLVDTEELVFDSSRFAAIYGRIRFQKLAAQITGNGGATMGWSVCLNVKHVEREEATFWKTIMKRIENEVSWSRYAVVYDNLLLEFDEYRALVNLVADQVEDAPRCIDLGAGTGNGSLRLLETDPEREVWSVELNETMLRHFRAKLKDRNLANGDRLTLVKDNVSRLDGFPPGSFDAAIMTNVLYAIDDREGCLRNVNRILKSGGILSLSTSYKGTDVDRLFNALQATLDRKGLLNEYQEQVDAARSRHDEMDELIHRDTIEDTVAMLEDAGFALEEKVRKAYVDAVIVIKAKKVGDPKPKIKPVETKSSDVVVSSPRPTGPLVRDVFISFCSEDSAIALALTDELKRHSIECFLAPRDLKPSSNWIDAVTGAIDNCRVMVLVLSGHASTSEMVKNEVGYAVKRGTPIIPFRTEDVAPSAALAFFLNNVHWLDAFPPPFQAHIPRLVESINFLLVSAAGSESSAGAES